VKASGDAEANEALLASPSSMSFEAQAEKSEDKQIRGCLIREDRQKNKRLGSRA
jgi:hypothetical protein